MPIIGEYETFGEPQVTASAKDYFSTVWKVHKIADASQRVYILKVISPRRRRNREEEAEAQLEADRGLEFVGVIKQIKQALADGARGLAPIHDFGTAVEGIWYATDFCERVSLKALVNRQGQMDDAALRHVVHSVVVGCQSLARCCNRSHGNLKLSNVLRGGQNQPLRHTPLLLVDPMPVPSARISSLDSGDRRSVEQTVHNVFEAQDLKAIGEILLQLVEGRVIESGFDYNYPIAASEAWNRLGKSAESWRTLCNRLLDPQLSLDTVNFVWLDAQVKPKASGRYLLMAGGVVLAAGLAGGGWYAVHLKSEGEFKRHLEAATQAMAAGDVLAAVAENAQALQRHADSEAARSQQKDIQALLEKELSADFTAAQQAEKQQDWGTAKSSLEKAGVMAGKADSPEPSLSVLQVEQDYVASMQAASAAQTDKRWEAAVAAAQKALGLKPGDGVAQAVLEQAQEMKSAADKGQAELAQAAADKAAADKLAADKLAADQAAADKAEKAAAEKAWFEKVAADKAAAEKAAAEKAAADKVAADKAAAEKAAADQAAADKAAAEKAIAEQTAAAEKAAAEKAAAEKTAAEKAAAEKAAAEKAAIAKAAADKAAAAKVAADKAAAEKAAAEQAAADKLAAEKAAAAKAIADKAAYEQALADGTTALQNLDYKLALAKATAALELKPGDAAASVLMTHAAQGDTFASDAAKAKSLALDDPGQALAALAEAKDLQAKNPDTIKPDASLDALEKEIAAVHSLDRQLEDLMRRYGVEPKAAHAVNPKNSSLKEYSGSEKSDNVLADMAALKNLKAKYKKEWLNAERSEDFSLVEKVLNEIN